MTDGNLQTLLKGNPRGWNAFVETYTGTIQRTVQVVLDRRGRRDPELVLDLIQDVFIRLIKDDFRLLRKFDATRASLGTYLSVIARSSTLDSLKRRRIPVHPSGEQLIAELRDRQMDPDQSDVLANLPEGLLSPDQMQVLVLLFDEELTEDEVALELGIKIQTVRTRKHRAIVRIRKFFAARERSLAG